MNVFAKSDDIVGFQARCANGPRRDTDDPHRTADKALRQQEGNRRSGQGGRHRRRRGGAGGLPRAQRRRKVDHIADADHAAAADLGHGVGGGGEHHRASRPWSAPGSATSARATAAGPQLPGDGRAGHAGPVLRHEQLRLARSGSGAGQDPRPDIAGEAAGQHAVRRSAPPARHRARADAQPRAALPRRAVDRDGSAEPGQPVGAHRSAARNGRRPRSC